MLLGRARLLQVIDLAQVFSINLHLKNRVASPSHTKILYNWQGVCSKAKLNDFLHWRTYSTPSNRKCGSICIELANRKRNAQFSQPLLERKVVQLKDYLPISDQSITYVCRFKHGKDDEEADKLQNISIYVHSSRFTA